MNNHRWTYLGWAKLWYCPICRETDKDTIVCISYNSRTPYEVYLWAGGDRERVR